MSGSAKVTRKKVEGLTLVTHKTGGAVVSEKEDVHPIGTTDSVEDSANVGVSLSYTKGLPNYSSVRVQVSLHLPCSPDMETVETTFSNIYAWVDEHMNTVITAQEKDLEKYID
ncbi:MAG: hypothetical protein QQN63_01030 [Nitrosopumilus sp.]